MSVAEDTSSTLSLQDRAVAETHCRALWGERQDDCAKHGADIPMPRVEVQVDELAGLLHASADLKAANEGWKRAFSALHDTLEDIAAKADLAAAACDDEGRAAGFLMLAGIAREALHTEDA